MADPSEPLVRFVGDCVWAADGDWECAFMGSVADARKITRSQAAAYFASETGERFTDIRVWKRHMLLLTRQDVWDYSGQGRYADRLMERDGVETKWQEHRQGRPDEWIYVNADTGEEVAEPVVPDEPPPDWEPSEYEPSWTFCDKSREHAIPVWICGFKGDLAP